VNGMNRIEEAVHPGALVVPRNYFKESDASTEQSSVGSTALPSYWLLLTFLFLLYANTPIILPALEVVRPAKVVAVAALLSLAGELVFGKRTLEWSWPEGGWLLLFLAAAVLSCLTAMWPAYAADAAGDLAKMAIVYFFIVNCATSEPLLRGVMWVMVIGGLFPALGTVKNFLQNNLEEGRATWVGIFGNPNEVAYSLVILLPLAAYLAAPRGWMTRVFLLGVAAIFLAAIFVTFSRGGLVGLAAVVGLYAWRKRSFWIRCAMVVVLAGGLMFAGKYWSRGEDFSQLKGDVSFQQRLATSKAGLGMFLDKPISGVGLNCSVIAWPLYAPKDLYTRGALITHNTLVQVLSETGILGFIPFALFIGLGIYHSRKVALRPETANLGIAIEGALWGLVICGMSGGYVLTWFPYLLMGLAASAHRIRLNDEEVTA
jgi:putative inorganic carbon (HCO3(-)) transporter